MLSPLRSYRYFHLDVFTDRLFSGNQLAVFIDGRGVEAETMQAIAKEMNFSETVFVLPPERPDSEARLRIFTPGEELPMAGHPTIGAAFALARAGVISEGRENLVFDLDIGPTPVSLQWRGTDLNFAWMSQSLPVFWQPVDDPAGAASALGLPPAAVGGSGLPVQVVSCGVPFLFVPLATRGAVDSAVLDERSYEAFRLVPGIDEAPILLFSTQSGQDGATAYSRMFAPGLGMTEDAATGGAAGALGCYLVRHKIVTRNKAGSMLNLQGVRMGRPSQLHISIGLNADEFESVRVGGRSVVAGEGILYI
jgi:trans-2,3-dihydro-3-hydroxyanthranilate isomerase